MYNLHIIEDRADPHYLFRAWFFGWADDQCNSIAPGCDAIFAARAVDLKGPWEVYSGLDDQGLPVWDGSMNPTKWIPVLSGGETNYDNWHNGDPTVVKRDDEYLMVYSATGFNRDGIPFGKEGDRDSDISVLMAATSKDGLNWTKSTSPILMFDEQWGQSTGDPNEYMHSAGSYHRPSLLIEDGLLKLWFDGYADGQFHMLYATNRGDFMSRNDWVIEHGLENPALENFPNPDVVKVDNLYLAFGDPAPPGESGWAARKITLAVSDDGKSWRPIGRISADEGWQANQVPEALVVHEGGNVWVYLTYGTIPAGTYYQDSIRMKRLLIGEPKTTTYKKILTSDR